jgi:hypothetical protein
MLLNGVAGTQGWAGKQGGRNGDASVWAETPHFWSFKRMRAASFSTPNRAANLLQKDKHRKEALTFTAMQFFTRPRDYASGRIV